MIMTIVGELQNSNAWVRQNWWRMLAAHNTAEPTVLPTTFYPDIIELAVSHIDGNARNEWVPPNDTDYRLIAYQVGLARGGKYEDGGDFLCKGNYIHPNIVVESINGLEIKGKVYCPGSGDSFKYPGIPGAIKRKTLCVLTPYNIKYKMPLAPGDRVMVVLNFKELPSSDSVQV